MKRRMKNGLWMGLWEYVYNKDVSVSYERWIGLGDYVDCMYAGL